MTPSPEAEAAWWARWYFDLLVFYGTDPATAADLTARFGREWAKS